MAFIRGFGKQASLPPKLSATTFNDDCTFVVLVKRINEKPQTHRWAMETQEVRSCVGTQRTFVFVVSETCESFWHKVEKFSKKDNNFVGKHSQTYHKQSLNLL